MEGTDISVLLAMSATKERILTAMQMITEHEIKGKDPIIRSYLMEVCLRKDIMFRTWVAVFDQMLDELVKAGKVLTHDTDEYPRRTYALPEEPTN